MKVYDADMRNGFRGGLASAGQEKTEKQRKDRETKKRQRNKEGL